MSAEPKNHYRPWRDRELRLLGTAADRIVAERLGRTQRAVETTRRKRGIAAWQRHRRKWTWKEVRLLGRYADAEVAGRLDIARRTVLIERQRREIAPAHPENSPKKAKKR